MSIEHNYKEPIKTDIIMFLKEKGYKLFKENKWDYDFIPTISFENVPKNVFNNDKIHFLTYNNKSDNDVEKLINQTLDSKIFYTISNYDSSNLNKDNHKLNKDSLNEQYTPFSCKTSAILKKWNT